MSRTRRLDGAAAGAAKPPPPPPPKLASAPEFHGGVVSRAARPGSSRPPAGNSGLPTLAPPKRNDSVPPDDDSPTEILDAVELDLDELIPSEAPDAPRPEAPSSKLAAICTYGRYEVLGRIAFGGMAEIFLGREQTSVGAARYLAIKRILPHVADDAQFVDMFLDEARLAIQLSHPNICHIYEFGELEGTYFIAMEWVNGVPLGKLIRKARLVGGIPPGIGARMIATVAEALHHAHRAKNALGQPMSIVHRDVSPHNIMVAYDGQVKLLDFGIAKATTQASKTQAGVVKGKFAYMAPEQALGRDIDGRSDVFALGICLWETLTGKPLYRRENEYETMHAVIHDPAPSIRTINPQLPSPLDEIVLKALEKKPENRFQSAGEMQMALERWISTTGKVENAAHIAELMDDLYEEQIKRGPLVDSTPFGESFQRRKPMGPSSSPSSSQSGQRAEPTGSMTAVPAPPRSPARLAMLAAALLVVGVGGGYLMSQLFKGEPPQTPAPVAVEPVPEPEAEPAEEALPEPVALPEPAAVVGTLELTTTPAGATVVIDGDQVEGETPLTLAELEPGTHAVQVARRGYRNWEGEVTIEAGETATLAPSLEALPRAPVAPPGRLSINTRPWSKVYVGRRLLGTTPIAEASVPSGTVRLRLVDRDGNTHRKSAQVPAGGTQRVFFDLNQ